MAEVVEGVNAGGVAVVPIETHGVAAYGLSGVELRSGLVHEKGGCGGCRSGLAGSARAVIAQEFERVFAAVPVAPDNLYTLAQ